MSAAGGRGTRLTELDFVETIDAVVGHVNNDGEKSDALILTTKLARQMAASGPLTDILGGGGVTLAGIVETLGLEQNQAGYEAALAWFLDHPTIGKLNFGPITFVGAFEHHIAAGACDKTIDRSGATFIPSEEEKNCLNIFNTLEWIEEVTEITPGVQTISESDPSMSGSAVTFLTLANTRPIKRGQILKIYSLDRLSFVNQGLDGEGIRRERAGELVMGIGNDGEVVTVNDRLGETYGGAGYEGTVRLAAYSMRKLEILGGHGTGNPIGVDTWRGWGHSCFTGFANAIIDRATLSDCYGAGLIVNDCWYPKVVNFDGKNFSNSRVSTGLNRYGYALMMGGATRGALFINPTGTNCRHLIDTGSVGVLNDVAELDYPWSFGVPRSGRVHGGSAIGLSNAPYGCHHNVRGLEFDGGFAEGTYVGDDSGGLPLASRGQDVYFKRMRVLANRNGGFLGGSKGGSIEGSYIQFGWNGIGMPCAEGMYFRDNELVLDQIFNDGAAISVADAYVDADGSTYRGSRERPAIIGNHKIRLKGSGAVGSPRFAIFRLGFNGHAYVDGEIIVDMTQYDGDVTIAEFDWGWPYTSLIFGPNARVIIKAGSASGTLYRALEPTANDDILITSLTRSGTTVTAVTDNSRLDDGMSVRITGAAQEEYNGVHADIVWTEDGFTFELPEGVEPASPATPVLTGIYYRRRIRADVQMYFEYHHDSLPEGGVFDQNVDMSIANVPWKRYTAGVITRDTSDFNFTASSDGFYLNRVMDDVTKYTVGGAGGFVGADIDPGIAPRIQSLTIRNASSRALQWTNPLVFLPPKASVSLKGGKGYDWIRQDVGSGEQLIFGGFVDLNVAGDQPLLPAMDMGATSWRWNFTRAVITRESGSFSTTQCILTASENFTDIDLTASSNDYFAFDIVHYRITFQGQVQECRLPIVFERGGDDNGNNVYAVWEAEISLNRQLTAAGINITVSRVGSKLVLTSNEIVRGASEAIVIENIVAEGANCDVADLGIAEGEGASGTGCRGGIWQFEGGTGQQFVGAQTDLSALGVMTIDVDAGRTTPFYQLRSYDDQVLYFRMQPGFEASATTLCDVYVYGNLV